MSCDHNLHIVSYLAKVDPLCSTPAASTTFPQYVREFWPPVRRRLPVGSTGGRLTSCGQVGAKEAYFQRGLSHALEAGCGNQLTEILG